MSRGKIEEMIKLLNEIILDKEKEVRLVLASFIARGHVLIEDIPGTGKTTMAKALARLLGLEFKRIQCTNDLLPADVIGSQVFDREKGIFVFRPGPIFSNVVLVDEINRASPRTQSGLLEAMGEYQVTVDRKTYGLPEPFFIIATQNPMEHVGTYPLPESQMDRFMTRISLGYPSREAQLLLLRGEDREEMIKGLSVVCTQEDISSFQKGVREVFVADEIIGYVVSLVEATRETSSLKWGISPRGASDLLNLSRAWAYISGRNFVVPEDIKEVFFPCSLHRLHPRGAEETMEEILGSILKNTPVF